MYVLLGCFHILFSLYYEPPLVHDINFVIIISFATLVHMGIVGESVHIDVGL